jgi:hypothetical protein
VTGIKIKVFINVCRPPPTAGVPFIEGAGDPQINSGNVCSVLCSFTPNQTGCAPYSNFASEDCLKAHEEQHFQDFDDEFDFIWAYYEDEIEDLHVPFACTDMDDPAEAVEAIFWSEDGNGIGDQLSEAYLAAADIFNDATWRAQSEVNAIAAENTCLSGQRAQIQQRFGQPSCPSCP